MELDPEIIIRRRISLARADALRSVKIAQGELAHAAEHEEGASDEEEEGARKATGMKGTITSMAAKAVPLWQDRDEKKKEMLAHLDEKEYNVEDFYKSKDHWAVKIATGDVFQNITLCVIVLNVIWIGIDADFNVAPGPEVPPEEINFWTGWLIMEWLFMFFYSFEIIVRFFSFVHKINAFKDAWFLFDFFLVFAMIAENLLGFIAYLMGTGGGFNFSWLAVLKIFRLFRLVRVVRIIRSVPELMTLVKSMLAAVRSVCAIGLLLIGSIYIFAVLYRIIFGVYVPGPDMPRFDTLTWAMFTLIQGTLSGEFPGGLEGGLNNILFLFHLILTNTLMLSMLIGLICNIVTDVGGVEKDRAAIENLKHDLKHHFDSVDVNQNGKLDIFEFFTLIQMPGVIRALEKMEIDVAHWISTADFVFDQVEEITFGKFVETALNLRADKYACVSDLVDIRKLISLELLGLRETGQSITTVLESMHSDMQMSGDLADGDTADYIQDMKRHSEGVKTDATSRLGGIADAAPRRSSFERAAEEVFEEKVTHSLRQLRDRQLAFEEHVGNQLSEIMHLLGGAPAGEDHHWPDDYERNFGMNDDPKSQMTFHF
jgi:hypothetical protein